MLTGRSCFVFVAVGATAIVASSQQSAESLDRIALLDEFKQREVNYDEAIEIWERYGRNAGNLETVRQLLYDTTCATIDRIEAALSIGLHGGQGAKEILLEFIARPLPEALTKDEANPLCWVISSLGRIGDDSVVAELKKLATRDYWNSRESQPTVGDQNSYWTQYHFRDCAVNGILATQRTDIDRIVESLIESGVLEDMHSDAVATYVEEAQRQSEIARGTYSPDEDEPAVVE